MAENFKLPSSSYSELKKIIMAYSTVNVGKTLTLSEISQASGHGKTIISGNNGFLVALNLITEGQKKGPTELGRNLGRALQNDIDNVIVTSLKSVIDENVFLQRMLSAIKIRGGMIRSDLVNHIVFSSGQNSTNQNKAGANAVIDMFIVSKAIKDIEGKINITSVIENNKLTHVNKLVEESDSHTPPFIESADVIEKCVSNNIIINININVNASQLEEMAENIQSFIEKIKS